jgi:integrase
MRALLNVKAIQAAKAGSKEYLLSDGDGLFVRVRPSGSKTWQFIYSNGPRRAKLTFGNVADVSLASARERAEQERARLARGDNPHLAQLERIAQQNEALRKLEAEVQQQRVENLSLSSMFDAWLADGVTRSDGNAALRSGFDRHILGPLGALPIKSLTEEHIRTALRAIGREGGKNRSAVLLLTELKQLFRWAEKRKPWRQLLVEGNPADLVEAKQVVSTDYDLANERERTLSATEIQELRAALERGEAEYQTASNKRVAVRPLSKETQLALWIMLSTCCRVGELSQARWENVDLVNGEWLIPRTQTKGKRTELMVFLSDFALRQFKALHELTKDSVWCFPARDRRRAISPKSFSKQVGDRQFTHKSRAQLKGRRNDNTLVLPGGDWTPHDLRRTGSTLMQSLGVHENIRERCLNHIVGPKIGRVYGRYDFVQEKQDAWQRLGLKLESILASRFTHSSVALHPCSSSIISSASTPV